MEKIIFSNSKYGNTIFEIDKGQINLRSLFGMPMFQASPDAPQRVRGISELDIGLGKMDVDDAIVNSWERDEDELKVWSHVPGGELLTSWKMDRELGILSRRDFITNRGKQDITLYKYWPKFIFASGTYECYVQNSTWCYENNGGWEPLGRSGISQQSEGGRTTQGGSPFLGIRAAKYGRGAAFHIIPKGNWEIRMQRASAGVGPQGSEVSILRLGHSSDRFACRIQPGQTLELPQLLIQGLPEGTLYQETESLQNWLRKNDRIKNQKPHKVAYNPWYACYDHINLEDMLRYAKVAKQIGCEVFEVDAGWYGQGADWGCCVGDWREKQDGAFFGKLKEFSDQIRAMGMGFGLWMEPERIAAEAPMRKAHPQWFARGNGGCYYPKLWEKEPYEYIKGEMLRLIETYQLVWMKIDFNFELEEDETRSQFLYYYENFYRLIDEIKALHPEVFMEACASGGLRTDINTMMHFDGHFICDNVNPFDGQSMYEQLMMRTFPTRIYQWMALQKGSDIPAYFRDVSDVEKSIVVPAAPGAGFADHERIDLDFLCKLMFRGMVGISGDITTLDLEDLELLEKYISFYKKFRPLLSNSVVAIDSEPTCIGDRDYWRVMEYYSEEMDEQLIYVYRFGDIRTEQTVFPNHIRAEDYYWVKRGDETKKIRGEDLLSLGIDIELPARNSGEIIHICPEEKPGK